MRKGCYSFDDFVWAARMSLYARANAFQAYALAKVLEQEVRRTIICKAN